MSSSVQFGRTTVTRSPGRSPLSSRALPKRIVRCSNSRNDTARSPSTIAGASPNSHAARRTRSWTNTALLDRRARDADVRALGPAHRVDVLPRHARATALEVVRVALVDPVQLVGALALPVLLDPGVVEVPPGLLADLRGVLPAEPV